MMSYTYWTGTPSVWIAILYLFLGLPLLLNPVASGTFFIWALAAGSAVYAVSHLARYIQERKEGLASGGDLFLTVVPLLFTIASLIWRKPCWLSCRWCWAHCCWWTLWVKFP